LLGKNFAPLAEKLNNVEWGEFLLKDLFNEIHQGRRLKKDDQISGKIPFVMSGITNCGVVGYISNPVASFPKNSITVDIFGNTFYRNYNFGAGDDTGVYWNSEKNYSAKTMLFFTAAIEKSLTGKFSYGKKLRSSQSKNFEIYLPTKDGEIDFEFMEKFITELEAERISELEAYLKENNLAYLTAAGLKDFILTDEEKFALENLNSCIWQKFYLTEIFKMANTKSIVKEKIIPESGKIPYVTASAENNGVMTYINCPYEWIDKGNCIMIGGKTLTFTFQEKDFCSNDSHNIVLYAKNSAEKILYLFYMSALRASMQNKYSWGNSISMKKIQDDIFYLPTKDGEIDYEFMEKFIRAVQKIIIADVVKYSEEKISAYRQAANK